MIEPSHSTSSSRAISAKRDPFLILADKIERNPWWVSSGEWDLPPEENQRGLRTLAAATRKRKPSVRALVKQAKAAGATSVILPDGTTINFSQEPSGEVDTPRDAGVVAPDRIIELRKRGR